VTAGGAAAGLTWLCRRLAPRLGFVDRPCAEAHKLHRQPVPVLGGPAIFGALIISFAAGLAAVQLLPVAVTAPHLAGIHARLPQLLVIGTGAGLLMAMGLFDDRKALRALPKFAIQALVCAGVAWFGPRVSLFLADGLATWLLTALWLMLVLNAINFLDNMDGLAAGITAICAFFFLTVAALREQYFVTLFGAVVCGGAGGFLLFNRPPASIFMGDSGSHVLGLCLGVLGAMTAYYDPGRGPASPTVAPVLIPLLVLAVPLFDLCAVVTIRTRLGRPFWVGDNRHISHRFELMGMGRPLAMLLVLALVFVTGAGALTLLWLPPEGVVLPLAQAALVLAVVSVLQGFGKGRMGP
jgi:UDP-GlcNAc:undecaprenyl-phosphate GlcNAc-1-phosphate transferase